MPLSVQIKGRVESFLADHDLAALYKEYIWTKDAWDNGFPEMRQLEEDLGWAAKQGYLTKNLVMRVAEWGRLRNTKRIQCPERFAISLYDVNDIAQSHGIDASIPLKLLGETIRGMGPTYLSKVLMFSRPRLYGAIDTRLVRVFGRGDETTEGLKWISLSVTYSGSGWCIPKHQASWPGEYNTWLEILRHLAHLCNTSGSQCPHPDKYVAAGLRERGIWIAADLETALFSYASKQLKKF